MQLWMFIVTILINDCVYSSFHWVKFEKLHSIVVKCTSRQSRTEAILFIFYQSKSKVNGIMVCIPVGQLCQFLIFLIILYWSNLIPLHEIMSLSFVTSCFIVEIQRKILLSFHAVAVVAYLLFVPHPQVYYRFLHMGYFNAIDSLCQIIYLVILLISSDKETFFDRQLMEYMTTIFLFNFVAVFISNEGQRF